MRFVALTLLFVAAAATADVHGEVEAHMMKYFDRFNARDIEGIASDIYSMPLQIGGEGVNRTLGDAAEARENLESLYGQLDQQGWARSVISRVDVCLLADGLAFADTIYARFDKDGNAIAPAVRTNVYVLRKVDDGWRIIAFYLRDTDKPPGCGN